MRVQGQTIGILTALQPLIHAALQAQACRPVQLPLVRICGSPQLIYEQLMFSRVTQADGRHLDRTDNSSDKMLCLKEHACMLVYMQERPCIQDCLHSTLPSRPAQSPTCT